ncbi:MAG: class B sortase [Clostridia bacterium]|nr:class B sortase [Clostridia bacterium]
MAKINARTKKNIIFITALVLAAAVFITSAVMLVLRLLPDTYDYDRFKTVTTDKVIQVGEKGENPIDFEKLQNHNSDVCAWIMVDGTEIDYPVLRPGSDADNEFYLNHNLDKEKQIAGSIYMEKGNSADFSDPNTVIYGHNMLNGSMFAALKKFRNADFFKENKYIYIFVPGHVYKYHIISAFVYDDRHILNSFNCYIAAGMEAYVEACINPASLVKNVRQLTVNTDDKLITLSTCTSKKKERYLVVAKLIEDIETK